MKKSKILIVDDDTHLAKTLKTRLQQNETYEVRIETNAADAVNSIREFMPELVILDIMMPGLTGLEVLEKIRAQAELDTIPVVLLSAKGRETDVKEGIKRGATEYITKPFRPAALLECVKRLLHDLPEE